MIGSITLVGAGRMGSAMLRGWIAADIGVKLNVIARNPSSEVEALSHAGEINLNPSKANTDVLVLAIKPQTFVANPEAFSIFADKNTIITSVMAGVNLSKLRQSFVSPRIVRAMPNTPGAIGHGVTLLAKSDTVSQIEFGTIASLFSPLGHVQGPMSEQDLQIGTALSGCGPAYFFYFAEMLARAGKTMGLTAEQADVLARQTLMGAGQLVANDASDLNDLREAVASPGGVTRAALDVMMSDNMLAQMVQNAVRAAINRDTELSS